MEYECIACDYETSNKSHYKRHVRSMHTDMKKFVVCCNKLFRTKYGLKLHRETDHVNKFDCDHCPKSYKSFEHFLRHVFGHINGIHFVCDVCGYATVNEDEFKSHHDDKCCKKTENRSGKKRSAEDLNFDAEEPSPKKAKLEIANVDNKINEDIPEKIEADNKINEDIPEKIEVDNKINDIQTEQIEVAKISNDRDVNVCEDELPVKIDNEDEGFFFHFQLRHDSLHSDTKINQCESCSIEARKLGDYYHSLVDQLKSPVPVESNYCL